MRADKTTICFTTILHAGLFFRPPAASDLPNLAAGGNERDRLLGGAFDLSTARRSVPPSHNQLRLGCALSAELV